MTIPKIMNQVSIREPGEPDVLFADTGKVPEVGAGEVLIKVEAAGINRPDVMQRQGNYNPPPGASQIPGLEVDAAAFPLRNGGKGFDFIPLRGEHGLGDLTTEEKLQSFLPGHPVEDGPILARIGALMVFSQKIHQEFVEKTCLPLINEAGTTLVIKGEPGLGPNPST